MKKLPRRKRNKIIALLIFILLVIALSLIALTERATGDEELMMCDGCKKNIKLDYNNGLFEAVHMNYEWPD